MDFTAVVFLGGFFVLTIIMICTMFGVQPNDQLMLVTMLVFFLLGCILALRQLYGKLAAREIFREMTDEQYEKFVKNKTRR
jgi:uncharacterized protein (DUF983 family)